MEKLDNRTYIILLAVSSIFWFLFNKNIQIHLSVALNALLLVYIKEYNKAIKFVITYLTMVILAGLFANKIALMYIILNMLARSIPLVMVVTCIVVGNSSELMLSLQKTKVPKAIIVMICILIRFFPVLSKENIAIRNGMKARGLFSNWKDFMRNPFLVYECFMVPLIIRCIKLSDELGATAELRGLNADISRSCIYEVDFGLNDLFVIVLYGAAMGLIYFRLQV
ncbi:energy-coupling factor transporter transmembrane component T family protein [Anaerococcus sp. Marseille-P9784]|uniref:energy-coupling factor transporter transmembrane component T family protein n=1 Tax=Anaerococcus sp. Marseille-P9784 TaxID=2614127 RepID=UPI00124A5341|nr:energy-coupling factor transporter transmembrane component T [Anaerococcus sp. Marseille-P9784]